MAKAKDESGALAEGLRKALSGPAPLEGRGGLFGGGAAGTKLAKRALDEGFLEETPGPAAKGGQPRRLGQLTGKGMQFLSDLDSPKKTLETLVPIVERLAAQLAPLAELVKVIRTTLDRLQTPHEEFAAPKTPAPTTSKPAAPARVEPAPAGGTFTREQLRKALLDAYRELCLYVEFQEGRVEIPRLFRETKRRLDGLSVREFHEELERLREDGQIVLYAMNQVHLAKEPELAIRHSDRLYYYLSWK